MKDQLQRLKTNRWNFSEREIEVKPVRTGSKASNVKSQTPNIRRLKIQNQQQNDVRLIFQKHEIEADRNENSAGVYLVNQIFSGQFILLHE